MNTNMNISKLSDNIIKGGIKEVFPLEEKNMSPFIANNISDFEQIIGKRLTNVILEKSVGRYEADIVADFADEDGCLIIENKIGQFDHDHLGKALTYMAYLNGKIIIWICDSYYDEHIKAINYLNDITSDEYSFYAIELQLYKIEDQIKYKYNIIGKPDYQVKLLASAKYEKETDTHKANKEFYNEFTSILEKNNITKFYPERRGMGYGWLQNVYGNISLMCNVNTRNKEIVINFESKNEELADKLLEHLNKDKQQFTKSYGKKNDSIIRLTFDNKIKFTNKPIEVVQQAANNFISILNLISHN